jgi:hypothetical protein
MEAREKAKRGMSLLKQSVLELLAQHPGGLRNFEVADHLGLRSHQAGSQKDYLSYSILGLLIAEGQVIKQDKRYSLP